MTQNGSIPNDATGDHPLVETSNRHAQSARERTIIAGPGIILKRTAFGVIVSAIRQPGTGGSASGANDGDARWA
jgi:hypothetical protein